MNSVFSLQGISYKENIAEFEDENFARIGINLEMNDTDLIIIELISIQKDSIHCVS